MGLQNPIFVTISCSTCAKQDDCCSCSRHLKLFPRSTPEIIQPDKKMNIMETATFLHGEVLGIRPQHDGCGP